MTHTHTHTKGFCNLCAILKQSEQRSRGVTGLKADIPDYILCCTTSPSRPPPHRNQKWTPHFCPQDPSCQPVAPSVSNPPHVSSMQPTHSPSKFFSKAPKHPFGSSTSTHETLKKKVPECLQQRNYPRTLDIPEDPPKIFLLLLSLGSWTSRRDEYPHTHPFPLQAREHQRHQLE